MSEKDVSSSSSIAGGVGGATNSTAGGGQGQAIADKPHHKMSMASKLSIKLGNIFSNDSRKHSSNSGSSAGASMSTATANIEAQQEKMRREEVIKCTRTSRVGFPYRPSSIAYDNMQRLLAVGTRLGYVKLYGGESIEYTLYHAPAKTTSSVALATAAAAENNGGNGSGNQSPVTGGSNSSSMSSSLAPSAVLHMAFVINEGALITYCDDSSLSFWNLRQKQPGILFTKKLVNERATCIYLPFKSNWLFVGTEKGNTYLLNVYNNFSQSGYDIKWNNVIELSQKTKPGKVVHLSDHPLDSSKLLIGFDSGLICLWNLKTKRTEMHFYGTAETMSSISWLNDGKQFMSSHNNGSLIVWGAKGDTKPISIIHPHMNENDLIPRYNMIRKVYWESTKNGEPLIIFSDGLPTNDCPMKDAITIIKNNKLRTIIEMKEKIIDFIVVNSSPWLIENSDPSALIVLLDNNLVVIDLKSDGYPQFQHHHSINLHESPVSACDYTVDPNRHFFQALLSSREKLLQDNLNNNNTKPQPNNNNTNSTNNHQQSQTNSNATPYPINGGIKCSKSNVFNYNELITTGHEDGSIRFWDSSGLGLSILHKLKTHKLLDRRKTETSLDQSDAVFKITAIEVNGSLLGCACAGGLVTLYRFNPKTSQNPANEELADIPLLEIPICYEASLDQSGGSKGAQAESSSSSSGQHFNFPNVNENVNKKDLKCCFRTKIGFRKQYGFQPELLCLLFWQHRPPQVTNIKIYPKSNLFLFGAEENIIGVDYQNRTVLINIPVTDLYTDPYHRIGSKSPKKAKDSDETEHVTHMLQKQLTMDISAHQQSAGGFRGGEGGMSKSSSTSSLENMIQNDCLSCVEINDYTTMCNLYKIELHQTTNIQLWVGTSFGSVHVLNCHSQLMGTQTSGSAEGSSQSLASSSGSSSGTGTGTGGALSSSSSSSSSSPLFKTNSITPAGVQYTMKGALVNISFLDANLNPIHHNPSSTLSNKAKTSDGAGGGEDGEDDFLNLESEFNYQTSNSIADNFGGAGAGGVAGADQGTNSSSSPSNTPTINSTFVNPFANTPPPPPPPSANLVELEAKVPHKTKRALTLKRHENSGGSGSVSAATTAASPEQEKAQYAVLTSENQIKVLTLPNQTCIYQQTVSDTSIAKASINVINTLAYLTCYMSNGNFIIYNLPNPTVKTTMSLNSQTYMLKERELVDRSIRTFTFGSRGHGMFMCSPSEIQKILLTNANGTGALTEMLCELFDPKVMSPPPPKPNLFKSLFGGAASSTPTDREELFGESSGKPSTCIVRNVEGEANKAKKELTELQKLALERGEKLNALEMKSEQMVQAASQFAKNASELANKYKSKKFF